jgi:hypothetical protein
MLIHAFGISSTISENGKFYIENGKENNKTFPKYKTFERVISSGI